MKRRLVGSDLVGYAAYFELAPPLEERIDANFAALQAWIGTLFRMVFAASTDEAGNELPPPEPMDPADFLPQWWPQRPPKPTETAAPAPAEEPEDVLWEGEWLSEAQYIAQFGTEDLPDVPSWW